MAENRLGKLSIVMGVMGVMALPFACGAVWMGCDSSGLHGAKDAAAVAGGGSGGQVTAMGVGGVFGAGGAFGAGGVLGVGGTNANSTAGIPGLDGGDGMGGTSGTGGAPMVPAPVVSDSGYVTMSAGTTVLAGFISSATAGSGSSIALTYGTSSFCASGTVAANSTYKSWANAGFSVKQDPSGASGSSTSLAITGNTISIGYVNHAGSELEFQFYDGSNYWCYILPLSPAPTTTTIPLSSLNTQCWDGLGGAFKSGTAIQTVSLVVPGSSVSATPFDFCFLGLTVN